MAVTVLLLWIGTAMVGSYLLARAIQAGSSRPARPEPEAGAAGPLTASASASSGAGPAAPPVRPVSVRDRFDPPSLQRAKAETMPGLHDLAEFAHPALALIGMGFWLGYVISRDRTFAAIGLGILVGAIAAGVSWFGVNRRATRRAAAGAPAAGPGPDGRGPAPLSFTPRLLALHAIGAALTLLFAVLIAARV